MTTLPNLAGVATQSLVSEIGTGSYKASYINWARTLQLLREHAPGWLPELIHADDGGLLHKVPVGACLLIRFRCADGSVTPAVPQAVMDNRNNAVPIEKITSRDITDTHRRGACMAAAFTFGLAYELWAKMPLETGFAGEQTPAEPPAPIDPWTPALRASGSKAANEGIEAYSAWWKTCDAEFRKAAAKTELHANYKLMAGNARMNEEA